jgi:AcrR family transcriptional regulator
MTGGTGINRLPADRPTSKKLSKAGKKTADDILVAAEGLFTQKGFKATTLKEVSLASGANTALISYYFGGKDGLRDAVLLSQMKKAGSGFEILANTAPEEYDLEAFKNLMALFLERCHEEDTMFRLVSWAVTDGGDVADKMAQMIWQPFFARIIEIFQHVMQGRVTREEAETRVWCLMGLIHAYAQCRWHSINHMKFYADKETFFENYRNLILKQVVDSLARA